MRGEDVLKQEKTMPLSLCVICGWPLSGKSTIAERASRLLNIRHLDINLNVRVPILGPPTFRTYEEFRLQDLEEMRVSYDLLLHAADVHLRLNRSILLSATFSRRSYQRALADLHRRHPEAKLRIVLCHPRNDSPDEVAHRISLRRAAAAAATAAGDVPYIDPVASMERY